MEFKAIHKFARTSGRKARLIMDMIRGKNVNEALDILRFDNKRAAHFINKLLRSAIANAEANVNVDVDKLHVFVATADDGPYLMRYKARAMGRATPIRKRMSHLTIVLSDASPKQRGRGEKQSAGPAAERSRAE